MKSIRMFVVLLVGWLSLWSVKADDTTQLVGFMTTNSDWLNSSDPTAAYGFYSFDTTGKEGFKALSPTGPDNTWANCGSAYHDGRYYCYDVYGSWTNYTLTYYVLDAQTWSVLDTKSFNFRYAQSDSEESVNARNIPCGMAYDPIDNTIWAVTHAYSNTESVKLCKVETATGKLLVVSELPAIRNLACDAEGQLYGVALDSKLYRIGKDGQCTAIGETGFWPTRDSEIKTGATIDFRNGKMYWSFFGFTSEEDRNYNRNGVNGLVEINTDNADATLLYDYPTGQRFSSLGIVSAHPSAPDNITDLSFVNDADNYINGTLTFTIPTVTYGQSPLTGAVNYKVLLDGQTLITRTAQAGEKVSERLERLAEGSHLLSVVLSANGHDGVTASTNIYVGAYVPSKVPDLTLTYDAENNAAVLTWSTPADANGGHADPQDLRYRIERMPGNTIVARSAKGNTFSEPATFPWNYYYYRITPYAGNETGPAARSNSVKMGAPVELPYDETFDTASSLNAFTLIDANGDGNGGEWDTPEWLYDEQYACAFYYGKSGITADDWLITPSLRMDEGTVYKLSFKYYAYYGYGSKFRVVVGSRPEVDGMDMEVLYKETVSSFSDYPGITQEVYFAPRSGDKFIGIHHISETMEHLSIDDIHVESYCPAGIPAAVENLTASKTGESEVTLSFNLPALNAGRTELQGPLTVSIYKDGGTEPVAVIEDKNPGESVTWKDENVAQSVHSYRVKTANAIGDGYEAEVSVDMRKGVPVAVAEVKASLINGNQIYLEWPASTGTVDEVGNPVDVKNIHYLVYKPVPDEEGFVDYKLIARDLDVCHFIDNNPREGLGEGVQYVYYYVAPVNGDDEGYATASNAQLLGESTTLPFAESWPNQTMDNGTWFRGASRNATWYVRYKGYDPMTDAYDGTGVASCETDRDQTFGMGTFLSPRLDLTLVDNPVLKFYMYQSPEYDAGVQLAVGMDWGDGKQHLISGAVYNAHAEEAGWREITVPLDDYTNLSSVSVAFYGYVVPENTIHIDNVSVTGTAYNREIALTGMATPAEARTGIPATVSVDVTNKGDVASGSVAVELKNGSQALASAPVPALAPGETQTVTLSYTPAEADAGKVVDLTFCLKDCAAYDTNAANNTGAAKMDVKRANSFRVSKIFGDVVDHTVQLQWNVPDEAAFAERVLEDVESYKSYAIDRVGAWTMYDGDKAYNYLMSGGNGLTYEWENCREQQAYIVFDTTPFALTLEALPVSGKQYFAAWPAATAANDDWLISPELPGHSQLLSFYARSLRDGTDAIEVLVSKTDTDPASFVNITGAEPVKINGAWNLHYFTLPEGTRHFAIRYVGNDGEGIMIDDLMYDGTPVCAPEGYNVYRNDVKLNDAPVSVPAFTDTDIAADGLYRYCVAPVYNGVEMAKSDDLIIDVSGIGAVGNGPQVKVNVVGGGIEVLGAAGRYVAVYAADGKCVAGVTASARQHFRLGSGVYIVSVDTLRVKVAVR